MSATTSMISCQLQELNCRLEIAEQQVAEQQAEFALLVRLRAAEQREMTEIQTTLQELSRRLQDAEHKTEVECTLPSVEPLEVGHRLFGKVQEEQKELTEIQRKLQNVHWISQEKFLQQDETFLQYLRKTSQIPLHSFGGLNVFSLADPVPYGYTNHHLILTNKNVLIVFHQATNPEEIFICPIYSFTSPLNLKQTQMFLNTVLYNPSKMNGPYVTVYDSPKRIESIIRSISGKYLNGHWTQLDGFFGMYLNEDTMELSAVPPPVEL